MDYISSNSTAGTVTYSYTILPNTPVVTYDLTMAVNPAGAGTTTPPVGTHARAENSVVNISATAAPGYAFSSWTGDVADVLALDDGHDGYCQDRHGQLHDCTDLRPDQGGQP